MVDEAEMLVVLYGLELGQRAPDLVPGLGNYFSLDGFRFGSRCHLGDFRFLARQRMVLVGRGRGQFGRFGVILVVVFIIVMSVFFPVLHNLLTGIRMVQPVLIEVDLAGARAIKKALPEAVTVFLAPPDWATLEARLAGRGTETAEVMQRRLETARTELAAQGDFDTVVVNSRLETACSELVSLLVDTASGAV